MKMVKGAFLIALALSPLFGARAQSDLCESAYMPFQEGRSFELSNYDKKDKLVSTVRNTVVEVDKNSDAWTASIEMKIRDKGKEETSSAVYNVTCKDGVLNVDMRYMIDPTAMEAMANFEMEISGTALEFPSVLSPGQVLPDAELEIKGKSGGMPVMTLRQKVTDRKVEGFETITTPAGTFDCVKISQNSEVKMLFKNTYHTESWLAKGVGNVKTINYDKKGKVVSTTMLTALE